MPNVLEQTRLKAKLPQEKKDKHVIGRLRIGSYRVRCDLGLKNAALGLRPLAAFSRPRSQFFPIRNSQPANNIYLLYSWRFSRYSAPTHWLVHGHMTSNNETVSRQMP